MSLDVTVYASGSTPASWETVLAELRRRGVAATWQPSTRRPVGTGERGGGFLRPEGGGGPEETITLGWEPLSDDMRRELLESPLAAGYEPSLRSARLLYQISMPDSAGAETRERLGHLVELLGGPSGSVAYDASEDRLCSTGRYRRMAAEE